MSDLPRQLNPDRIGPMQELLSGILANNKTVRMLEIGSFAGESARLWLDTSKRFPETRFELTCIDPWQAAEQYLHTDKGPHYERTMIALSSGAAFSEFLEKVRDVEPFQKTQYIKSTSFDAMPMLVRSSFNLIYIDGDHSHSSVSRDISNSIPLLCPRGIICGDDLELEFSAVEQNHCRMYKEIDFIRDPILHKLFHPGVTFALSEVPWTVKSKNGFWWFTVEFNGVNA